MAKKSRQEINDEKFTKGWEILKAIDSDFAYKLIKRDILIGRKEVMSLVKKTHDEVLEFIKKYKP
jgi:hypothetical protein